MIPIGYMLKNIVVPPPDWMNAPSVDLVYSVSNHVSNNFLDYIPYWKHNGWWMFDSPSVLRDLAAENGIDLNLHALLYYEVFESEYDAEKEAWLPIAPEKSFRTMVEIPEHKILLGYDVVTFSVHTSPECSPLSCNALASEIATNRFCLLDDFQFAHDLAERKVMHDTEPGPYRIIAVYRVD